MKIVSNNTRLFSVRIIVRRLIRFVIPPFSPQYRLSSGSLIRAPYKDTLRETIKESRRSTVSRIEPNNEEHKAELSRLYGRVCRGSKLDAVGNVQYVGDVYCPVRVKRAYTKKRPANCSVRCISVR